MTSSSPNAWRKSDTGEYELARYKNEIQIEPYDVGRVVCELLLTQKQGCDLHIYQEGEAYNQAELLNSLVVLS